VGIIFAAMAMGAQNNGDYAGAADKAGKAKLFSYIGIALGLVIGVLYIIFGVLVAAGAAAGGAAGAGGTP